MKDISWPLPNVWLGTSVEDQACADERIPLLLRCPAAVRFLSCEPLLGPLSLERWLNGAIGWVIVGGESGPRSRPCDVKWVGSVVAQARAAGVPCFVKQLGARPGPFTDAQGREIAGGRRLRDRKGADMAEWPEALRVREMPR